jgi:hypothetical protein
MFILNNIHDWSYNERYPGIDHVIFDLGDTQLANRTNHEWNEIEPGNIVCVVRSSRTIDLFHRVERRFRTEFAMEGDRLHVITGRIAARMHDPIAMQTLLNRFHVEHYYLPNNQFRIGFNVGNVGTALDELMVRTRDGDKMLGEL